MANIRFFQKVHKVVVHKLVYFDSFGIEFGKYRFYGSPNL